MQAGCCYTLFVTVEKVTNYQRDMWHREGTETVYRYRMHDQAGEHYVFTGKWVYDFEVGNTYEIRATAKEYEIQFHNWRLKRLRKIRKLHDGEMLSF
jgi:hypothetical protein